MDISTFIMNDLWLIKHTIMSILVSLQILTALGEVVTDITDVPLI